MGQVGLGYHCLHGMLLAIKTEYNCLAVRQWVSYFKCFNCLLFMKLGRSGQTCRDVKVLLLQDLLVM